MINYKIKDTALDATAIAIQLLTGVSSQFEWNNTIGFADVLLGIETGNNSLKNFIENHGTISNFDDPGCSNIGDGAFYDCYSLTTANFLACKNIGSYAFYNCSNLTTASFPACKSIGSYAFYNCPNLTTVNFPVCTKIDNYTFFNNYSLTITSFPACTNIGSSAFYNCFKLTTMDFPACTNIRDAAFYYCSSLTTVSFPACTNIGSNAFCYCSNLTTANFPVCTNMGYSAFYYCSRLTTANFPVCTSIGSYAFYCCSRLTTVNFPVCTSIGSRAFDDCYSLTTVSFSACMSIGSGAFSYCNKLTTCIFSNTATASSIYSSAFYKCYRLLSLYLLGSTIYNLQNTNVFNSTPISTYTSYTSGVNGSIFVPQSLLATYKATTNWVTYSARFAGLTDAQITALENGINLIKFTINGSGTSTSYFAEEGMTWQNWVNSEYNTDGLHIYDNYGNIFSSDDSLVVSNKPSLQLEFTVPNAYIQSNYTYYYVNAPGSSGGSSN